MTAQIVGGPRITSSQRRHIVLLLVLGGGVSLALYLHGAGWWYAPMALVLIHGAILAGVVLLTTFTIRGRSEGTLATAGSTLIRRPRLYDWIVGFVAPGGERKFRGQVLDLAEVTPGDDVLDIGCGTGSLLLAAARRAGSSGTLHGVDPAPEMIAHGRKKAVAANLRVELREGSAERLPYADASFDVLLCTMVLHHLPRSSQQQAIAEMRRVLRPRGRVVIVDLQRPRGIAAVFSLVTLLHGLGSGGSFQLLAEAQAILGKAGFVGLRRETLGRGALGAIVGHLSE